MRDEPTQLEALWVIFFGVVLRPVLWAACALLPWRWFVTPMFHVAAPSLPTMLGLGIFSAFFVTPQPAAETGYPEGWRGKFYGRAIGVPFFLLGASWLVHQFA